MAEEQNTCECQVIVKEGICKCQVDIREGPLAPFDYCIDDCVMDHGIGTSAKVVGVAVSPDHLAGQLILRYRPDAGHAMSGVAVAEQSVAGIRARGLNEARR